MCLNVNILIIFLLPIVVLFYDKKTDKIMLQNINQN